MLETQVAFFNCSKLNLMTQSKKFKTSITGTLILTFIFLFNFQMSYAQVDTSTDTQGKSVVDVIDTKEDASDFAQLLKDSGFAAVLKKQGPYTILAPSNEALETSNVNIEELKKNPKKLVQGHLYQGELSSDQVESQMGVSVEETDEAASNGTVHVVDQVVERQSQ